MSFTTTTILALLLILLMISLQGCESTSVEIDSERSLTGNNTVSTLKKSMSIYATDPSAGALSMTNNGLEVLQWIVGDEKATIGKVMSDYGQPAITDPEMNELLHRNGLRLQRIKMVDIEAVKEALGGATFDQKWWFGQVFNWREVHRRPLENATRAIAINGHVRRFTQGSFDLLVRSWTIKTEDGPRLYFEVTPYFEHERANLRRLMEVGGALGESFPSASASLRLEAGYAYVLTCESPSVNWSALEDYSNSGKKNGLQRDLARTSGSNVRGSVGPHVSFGPDTVAAATVGEMLLRGFGDTKVRGMIVFVPRVPRGLYPDELLSRYDELNGFTSSEESSEVVGIGDEL